MEFLGKKRFVLAALFGVAVCLLSGTSSAQTHAADTNHDAALSLEELLRVVQLFNASGFYCESGTEDGYSLTGDDRACALHSADYELPHWQLSLSELLRQIQIFRAASYGCSPTTEDGFQPGASTGCVPPQDVVINEFLTVNDTSILDEDGDREDWIELYNPNDFAVNLSGWSLSDSEGDPREWVLPGVSIPADGYLIVFASDKNRAPADGGQLHANFKLTSNGEYLALFTSEEPPRAATEFLPGFPAQSADISYGRLPGTEDYGVLGTPTPGAANTLDELALPKADAPTVSPERGFYEAPIAVTLSVAAEDAQIRYTLDGSEPSALNGEDYTGPIGISGAAVLRAAVLQPGTRRSDVVTHTYQFGEAARIAPLAALAISGDEQTALYEPDGVMAIVGGTYESTFWKKLVPTDYNNAIRSGLEREVSFEYFSPLGENFQFNAGLRVHGSPASRFSRSRGDDWVSCECGPGQPDHCVDGWTSYNKFTLRLYFREEFGQDWLDAAILPESPVARMQHLILRGGTGPCDRFLNDEFGRRLHGDMGYPAPTGEIFALYINGDFKGHYDATLRLRESFFQEAYGSSESWDVIKEQEEVVEGDNVAWRALMDFAAENDLSDGGAYAAIGDMLDVTAFADYLLLQLYAGNSDWPGNNWTAARERTPGSLFRFYAWDIEAGFGNVNVDNFNTSIRGEGLNGEDTPVANLYRALRANADFRVLMAERAALHLGPGGALAPENLSVRDAELRARMAGVFPGISTAIADGWIPGRAAVLMDQFTVEGLSAP